MYELIRKKKSDTEYTRDRNYREVTKEEIVALLGLLYLIGREGHARVQELWASDRTGMPILRACMSHERFL